MTKFETLTKIAALLTADTTASDQSLVDDLNWRLTSATVTTPAHVVGILNKVALGRDFTAARCAALLKELS